jgi:hypothetical protein
MTLQPEDQSTIYERIKSAIASASEITNFSPNSPEKAISDDGFAAEMRERQHEALSVQLSARIDYAGKTITTEDLEDLDVDPEKVDLDLLNSFQSDDDLDELAKRNSIFRDPGDFATGTVTFQTKTSKVTVSKGTVVGTQPDADGDYLAFETTEAVTSADGETTVDAPIEAANRGTEYNVGSGTITYIPSPPPGVEGDPPVENAEATTGGENEEPNEDLRTRAKNALVATSGGGTKGGLEGAIVAEFAGLDDGDVTVDEFPTESPPYGDVIIDGGPSDSEAQDAIDRYRPVAINHNLVRPTTVKIDLDVTVTGTDVDAAGVEADLNDYLTALSIGDDVIRDQLIATTITADADIEDIDSLTVTVTDETHTYQTGTDVYALEKAPIIADSVANVDDASGDTYTNGTDYDEADDDGDGEQDAIDFSVGGSAPDDGEDFFVDYEVPDDIPVGDREKADPGAVNVTVA